MSSGASNSDQESLVEALLEGMGESFFALDRDWRCHRLQPCGGGDLRRAARPKSLAGCFGTPCPKSRGRNSTDVAAMSWRSARREEFESYSALRPDRYHEVRAFPFGDGVGVAFRDITDRQRDTQALRGRELELARVQRIGGVGGLEVDLVARLSQSSALQNISTFMAFPPTSSTTRTSSGSRAFIRKIENGLRSTFWPRSRALARTIKPNIA